MNGWMLRVSRWAWVMTALPLLPGVAFGAQAATDAAPVSITGSYLAGRFAQQHDDWASAADFLQRVLAASPEDAGLVRRTFILLVGDGRLEQALPLARRLTGDKVGEKAGDLSLPSTLLLADAARAGRYDEALARIRAVPLDGMAMLVRPLLEAWALAGKGDTTGALDTLAPLRDKPGFNAMHNLHAGLILELGRDMDGAAKAYAGVLDDSPPLRVVQVVGGFYERTDRKDEARALYEAFQARFPDSQFVASALARIGGGKMAAAMITDARQGIAEALFDVASALHQEGVEETALVYGQIALHLRPDFPLVRLMIGDLMTSRDQPEGALAQYRAIGGDPDLGWAARQRAADTLSRLERLDEAVATLEGMAAERADRPEPLIRVGDLLRAGKRFGDAVKAYDRALARVKVPESRNWSLYYARGMALERLDRWAEAEADLLKALELNPEQPFLLNYLGYSWVDRGVNLDKARGMIEKAVRLKPDDGYITDSLGWVLYLLGDAGKAVPVMERAVELRPLDATINDHLGDVYWAVGRKAEARFQWQRALSNADDKEDGKLIATVRDKLERGLPERRAEAK